MEADRFARAIAAIDAANAADPSSLVVRGSSRPKALAEAELATEWIKRLVPEPTEELLLATRAHHLRRWTMPRSTYPEGRKGYLRWKDDLHRFHADAVAEILEAEGYADEPVRRVQAIVAKKGLRKDGSADSEVQALEDALCLVFVETQYDDLVIKVADDAKMAEIVDKTLAKMSESGRAHAAQLMGHASSQ